MYQVLYECQESGTANWRGNGTIDHDGRFGGFCDCCWGEFVLVPRNPNAPRETITAQPLVLPRHWRSVMREGDRPALPVVRVEDSLPSLEFKA